MVVNVTNARGKTQIQIDEQMPYRKDIVERIKKLSKPNESIKNADGCIVSKNILL